MPAGTRIRGTVGSVGRVSHTGDVRAASVLRPRRLPPVGLTELFADAADPPTPPPSSSSPARPLGLSEGDARPLSLSKGDARPLSLSKGDARPLGLFKGDVQVTGITLDTRLVEPGDLFVALPGRHHHGSAFAETAVRAGAVAVLTDTDGAPAAGEAGVPVVVVADPRHAMAAAAARIYADPAAAMTMYAITGTNGKTTTAYLLEAALLAGGESTGLIGTIGFRLAGADLPAARTTVTTPESPELQGLLGYLREGGADSVVMEVSSHALVLGRADAIVFDVAAFTNLGRDHLDFHGDLESYFEAKAVLFTPERTRHAVLNVDDARGVELLRRVRAADQIPATRVGFGAHTDVRALRVGPVRRGRTRLRASVYGEPVEAWLSLPGEYNVRNALTALAMVGAAGGDVVAAAAGLAAAVVPGRMQRVELGPSGPVAYVDFAHTPQAVTAALAAARESADSSAALLVVLGCGGDRDRAKRGPIGEAAAGIADVVVVTDDNPRGEDPATIREAVLRGARTAARSGGRSVEVVDGRDRRSAIAAALRAAGPADVVAVLGKGHESGQEVAGTVRPFVDADVLRTEWATITADRQEAP